MTASVSAPLSMALRWNWHVDRSLTAVLVAYQRGAVLAIRPLDFPATVANGDTLNITVNLTYH